MEPDGMDMADCATDGFEHDMTFSLLSQEQNSLHEIDAALHRILEDKYGICEESGQPIPEARLRAIPWTRYTREAAENLEKKTLTNGPHLGNLASIRRPRFSETLETDETATKPFQPTEVIRHRRQPDYEPSKSETETWTPAITFSQE
jgi:RNA polymerase-binding transcription factor DksA